jgi:hypothetical protein
MSRWKRIEVRRIRSTTAKIGSPSWLRTVSPRMRPRRRISSRSGKSLPEVSSRSMITRIRNMRPLRRPRIRRRRPLCVPKSSSVLMRQANRLTSTAMIALLCFLLSLLVSPFKSKSRLEAENVALRRQLIILRRKVRSRVHLTNGDRFFFVSCIDGFHRSSRPSRSSGRRPLCAGIGPVSADIGGGNPAPLEVDRKSTRTCAR